MASLFAFNATSTRAPTAGTSSLQDAQWRLGTLTVIVPCGPSGPLNVSTTRAVTTSFARFFAGAP